MKLAEILRLIDVNFAAGKRRRDHRAWRLNQQGSRASVSAERVEMREGHARKHGWNSKHTRIS